ncbi:carbohydrate sulfotransferase 15-like [Lytechinus variegatus]|uniref:carbohydrate sulfotransferase 15-like n=1 Tax=Lytechinus variegatus TaxID=7654 RepID=UPI001BB22773|nr:carbohydrate sulfotransferase 15-like [Lytechinus variegatus]
MKNNCKFSILKWAIVAIIICELIVLDNREYLAATFFNTISRITITPLPKSSYINTTTRRILEVNYTIRYGKAEHSNHSSLYFFSDEGKCQGLSCKWSTMPGATRELVKWAPEIFEKVPLDFLGNFKNPCWLRNKTELNCLPYFYVIGTSKCGTTDIWEKILSHPDVINVPKEPHWWGPRRLGFTGTPCHGKEVLAIRKLTGGEDDSSFEWYLNLYKSLGVPKIISNNVTAATGIPYYPKVFGDASISTSYTIGLDWTKTFPNASEPVYTNAQLLRAVQPNAKIILMVRDPTVRAISYYWYSFGNGNPKSFHDITVKQIGCLRDCLQKHNIRYCAYAAGCPYTVFPALKGGLYSVFARDWMEAFSPDGVLVIRLEDLETQPLSTYRKIIKFLDLGQLSEERENEIIYAPKKNVNRRRKQILPETKQILDDFYAPYNKDMALLMKDDKFLYPVT